MKKLIMLFVVCVIGGFISSAFADYLGSWKIGDYVPIPVSTHRFTTGGVYAPTILTYSIYEDANAVGLDESVDMVVASPFDSVVGFYLARRQLTAAAGFEAGKNYTVLVKATVDSVSAIVSHTFQINAAVDVNTIVGEVPVDATTRFDTLDGKVDDVKAETALIYAFGAAPTSTDIWMYVDRHLAGDTNSTGAYTAAVAAQAAAEKIDSATELRTFLFGGNVKGATEPNQTLGMNYSLAAKTAAEKLDTAGELRILLTGVNAALALHTDVNDSAAPKATALSSAIWTNTKAGYIDMKISDVNGAGGSGTYIYALDTTVAEANSTNQFTLTDGVQNDNAYFSCLISVRDTNDSHYELRFITSYTGATRTVIVDLPFTFTPAAGDVVHILETGYIRVPYKYWPYGF